MTARSHQRLDQGLHDASSPPAVRPTAAPSAGLKNGSNSGDPLVTSSDFPKSRERSLPAAIRAIDWLNDFVGRMAAWLMVPVVAISFLVVVLRYVFGVGYPWMQELFVWIHAATFMLAVGYTFAQGAHVRVDVLYSRYGMRFRAWSNIIGTVFLLFTSTIVIFWLSYPQVRQSWIIGESSTTENGLPFVYVVKTLVLAFCVLACLHGISLLYKSVLALLGHEQFLRNPDAPAGGDEE
jgi:TRAP-type mannitol/chloroaromatic compound transport system permease small subunit